MVLANNLHASLYDAQKLTEKIEGLLIESGGELTSELEDLISFKEYQQKDLIAHVDIVATSIERIDHTLEFYEAQIDAIKSIQRGLDKAKTTILDNIAKEMEKFSLSEINGEYKSFKFKLNPPKVELPQELNIIPPEFKKIEVVETVDKKLISESLKKGEEVPGCRLIQGKSLKISNCKKTLKEKNNG